MKLYEIQQPNIEQILQELNITDYEITPRGVDVNGNVKIPKHWTEIPFQFNIIDGTFDCWHSSLTSLKNGPRAVGGDFWCNTKITSLQGAPREVGGSFVCGDTKIVSLQGAPVEVGGSFICSDTKIKGKPNTTGINIGGSLYW